MKTVIYIIFCLIIICDRTYGEADGTTVLPIVVRVLDKDGNGISGVKIKRVPPQNFRENYSDLSVEALEELSKPCVTNAVGYGLLYIITRWSSSSSLGQADRYEVGINGIIEVSASGDMKKEVDLAKELGTILKSKKVTPLLTIVL